MPAVVTFDGPNRRIHEINTGLPRNTLDLVEVYSEWKEWVAASSANAGIVQGFRYIGGDPITAIQNAGSTFFLMNGWKFVPADYNHQLVIDGNLYTDPADGDRTDFTTITAQGIEVVYSVSNLVDAAVARLDLAQLQEAVYLDQFSGTAGAAEGVGTPTNPALYLADAFTIAAREGIHAISIVGDYILDRSVTNYRFTGTVSKDAASLDLNGYPCIRSNFQEMTLSGNAAGSALYGTKCQIGALTNSLGLFYDCGVSSVFSAGTGGKLSFINCYSDVPGSGRPTIDLADNLSDDLQLRGWKGGVKISNLDVNTQKVSIDVESGTVELDATCIDCDSIVLRGVGHFINNSSIDPAKIQNYLVSPESVTNEVLNAVLSNYGGAGDTMSDALQLLNAILALSA